MAKPVQQKKAEVRFEYDWSDENQDRCPGYRIFSYQIWGEVYETLIRCDLDRTRRDHLHQYALRVVGNERQRVPLYPWIVKLRTEAEAIVAIERRRARTDSKHEARQDGAVQLRSALTPINVDIPPEVMDWLESQGSEAEGSPERDELKPADSLGPPDPGDDRDADIPAL